MKYYVYERYVDSTDNPNAFSGKYLRFVDDPTISELPMPTLELGYTTEKPNLFLLPNHPYADESPGVISFTRWLYSKDTQNLFTVKSGNSVVVKENSVYTFANQIQNLNLTVNEGFFKESSVFFTFTDSGTHTVSFNPANKVIGSQQYWESGKSYIITVYNEYYIIGVVRAN